MLSNIRTHLREFVRCTRHNVMHLRRFRVSYRRGQWHVTDGSIEMVFPYYPYLAFHDIEGYVQDERSCPKSGMTVLDAGGCYGEFSLYASKCVGPTGRVLMLEPDPANIAVAERIFALNGNPKNIEVIPAGLWDKPGRLRFSAGHEAQSAVVREPTAAAQQDTIEIDVLSLPSLVQQYHLDRLDIVKMDIEGAELEVISAANELPREFRPSYAIASYHVVNGRKTADVLPVLFGRIGYECRTGYRTHLTTWASDASSSDRASNPS